MNTNTKAPELLMPAGSLEKLQYAFAYGADAVYAGVPFFSLRARENEFRLPQLKEGIEHAHSLGKKVYLTANIFGRNHKIKSFLEQLDSWVELNPDAMIMSDPGLLHLVREKYPDLPIHLSVQANCMNWSTVKFWHSLGVERVILSRELRLTEIEEIKNRVPEMELEAFVHGSICIAHSGRCLLSHYMSYRDANQGVCDNSCRYKYKTFYEKPPEETGRFFLQDERDPDSLYQIDEDEHGSYIMNAKDLKLIDFLKPLQDAGVCSFKVEGRTKSVYYLSMVTRAYRRAIDDMVAGKEFDPQLHDELNKVANRGYHRGFVANQTDRSMQNYTDEKRNFSQKFAGMVRADNEFLAKGLVPIEVRNKLQRGQRIEILSPLQNETKIHTIGDIYNLKGEAVDTAHGGTGLFGFRLPETPSPYSIVSQLDWQ